jgi:tRNA(Ile)-lysidine synthase
VEFQNEALLLTKEPFPEQPAEWEVRLLIPGSTRVDELGGSLNAEILERDAFDLGSFARSKSAFEEALDARVAGDTMMVRPVGTGDSFRPLGMKGSKKISDFLIDEKVSLRKKAGEAVVVADGRIAWLLGRRMDERFSVSNGTERVLLLSWIPDTGVSGGEGVV